MPRNLQKSTSGVVDELRQLMEARTHLRLRRSPPHAEDLDGFVVALGTKWALLQTTRDGGYFDGWNAFRIDHVRHLETRDDSFERRVSEQQPLWPPRPPLPVALDRTADLITGLEDERLVGIERERARSALWVGRVRGIEGRWVWLHEIDPRARWHRQPLAYRLRTVTRIQIRTDYLTALTLVAPQPQEH